MLSYLRFCERKYVFIKSKFIALGLVVALGAAACSGGSGGAKEKTNPTPDDGPVSVSVTYYDNGTMITRLKSDISYDYSDIFSFCQGQYIVDETRNFPGASSNSISRTLAPEACPDGRLTANDFPAKH